MYGWPCAASGRWRSPSVLLLLMLTVTARCSAGDNGYLEECKAYAVGSEEHSLMPSYTTGKKVVLGVPHDLTSYGPQDASLTLLSLTINTNSHTAQINITRTDMWCKDDQPIPLTESQASGWWRHLSIALDDDTQDDDDDNTAGPRENMCVVKGSEPYLASVTPTSSHVLFVFNCHHGCPLLDDTAAEALTTLPLGSTTPVYVRSTSAHAMTTLTLLNCEPLDGVNCNVTITSSDLGGGWQRLRLDTKNVYVTDTHQHEISVIWTNDILLAVFKTPSQPLEVQVVSSSNMSWAIGCDPEKHDDLRFQKSEREEINKRSTMNPIEVTCPEVSTPASAEEPNTNTVQPIVGKISCDCSPTYRLCLGFFLTVLFLFLIFPTVAGYAVYRYVKRKKILSPGDSDTRHIVKMQHSVGSGGETTSLERGDASSTYMKPSLSALNSNCVQNSRRSNAHSKTLSIINMDESSGVLLHPPSSPPPPPTSMEQPMFPTTPGSLLPQRPLGPPPPPTSMDQPMFPNTPGSLSDAEHHPIHHTDDDDDDSDDDDDDHDYDYLDINILHQQLTKDKKEKKKTPTGEIMMGEMEESKISLSRHDSDNSLYNSFTTAEDVKGNSAEEKRKELED